MSVKKIYCCTCMEYRTRQELVLKYNPYYFKRKAYCKKCGKGALITK